MPDYGSGLFSRRLTETRAVATVGFALPEILSLKPDGRLSHIDIFEIYRDADNMRLRHGPMRWIILPLVPSDKLPDGEVVALVQPIAKASESFLYVKPMPGDRSQRIDDIIAASLELLNIERTGREPLTDEQITDLKARSLDIMNIELDSLPQEAPNHREYISHELTHMEPSAPTLDTVRHWWDRPLMEMINI